MLISTQPGVLFMSHCVGTILGNIDLKYYGLVAQRTGILLYCMYLPWAYGREEGGMVEPNGKLGSFLGGLGWVIGVARSN